MFSPLVHLQFRVPLGNLERSFHEHLDICLTSHTNDSELRLLQFLFLKFYFIVEKSSDYNLVEKIIRPSEMQ